MSKSKKPTKRKLTEVSYRRIRTPKVDIVADPVASAKKAQLRYVTDEKPGIRRKRQGEGFAYFNGDGKRVGDKNTLVRIRQLAIPPAWTDVWISPVENGHLQATGRDARRRKQYKYHARWRQVRDETKYSKIILFAAALPKIRAAVEADLKLPGLAGARCWRPSCDCWKPR